ncbi:MAG: DUF4232 domain-containing protein [Treponema sp.]|jgi:hypothetical protein|nr:DUF4232 domain-containing protein [Treponema sp.]
MKRARIILGVLAALAASGCGQMTGFETDNKFEGLISGTQDGVDGKRNIRGPAIFLYAEDKEYGYNSIFDYGTISIDEIPGEKTVVFSVKNEGENDLTLTGSPFVALTGDDAFSIVAQPVWQGSPLIKVGNRTGDVTFSVKFKPSANARYGVKTSVLTIKSDDKKAPELTITLQATGTNGSWQALWGTADNERLTRGVSNSDGNIFVTGYIGPDGDDKLTEDDERDFRDGYIAELDPRTGLVAGEPEKYFKISERSGFNTTAIAGISAMTLGDYIIGGQTAYKNSGYRWNGYALAKISDFNKEPYSYYFYTGTENLKNGIPVADDYTDGMMFYPPLDYEGVVGYDEEGKPVWEDRDVDDVYAANKEKLFWADSYLTTVLYDHIWEQILTVGTVELFEKIDNVDYSSSGLFINGHFRENLSLVNNAANRIFIPFDRKSFDKLSTLWGDEYYYKYYTDDERKLYIDNELKDENGAPVKTSGPYQIYGAAAFDNGVVVVGSVVTEDGQKALAIYVKMSPNIVFGWARVYGGINSSFQNAVKVGNDVLLLGYTNGDGHTTGEGYVVKLSPGGDGTPAFAKSTATLGLGLSNLTEFFNGLQDADGNYVLVGQSNSAASGDTQKQAIAYNVANATGSHGMEDGYLVKLNSAGEVLIDDATKVPYQRWFGGGAQDQIEGICETSTYYYLIGYSKSNFAAYNNKGAFDNWVLRIPKDTLELQE